MIVDSMTPKEIVSAVKKDLENNEGRILNIIKKFRSDLLSTRNRKFPCMIIYKLLSAQKIQYFFGMSAEKRSSWKNPSMMIGGTYILKDGQYGFMICPNLNGLAPGQSFLILSPHFIRRYRERMLKDEGMSTDDVIMNFVRKNHSFFMTKMTLEHNYSMDKYEQEGVTQMAVITTEGCCIAEHLTHDYVILTTFIRTDMLSERQKRQFSTDQEYGNNKLKVLQAAGCMDKDIKGIELDFENN